MNANACTTSGHVEIICVVREKCVWIQWLNAPQALNVGTKVSLPFIVADNGANRVSSLIMNTTVFIIGVKLKQDVCWVAITRMPDLDLANCGCRGIPRMSWIIVRLTYLNSLHHHGWCKIWARASSTIVIAPRSCL